MMNEINKADFWIKVSVVVPCYNERNTIQALLIGLINQTYPLSKIEIIISDGFSTDGTRDVIQRFCEEHLELSLRIVDNPDRHIASGINRGIEAAIGEFIVRLDAHSVPDPNYIAYCVEALSQGIADNVGGVWEIIPGGEGVIAHSIAAAASNPLAVGDARYRYAKEPAYVDTVPFGSFRKSLVQKIGLFDETLLTNEDYEFNTRIRSTGGKIWMDPKIRSKYYARSSIIALAKQYWRYGYWKARMVRKFPGSLRWRQAIPPLFVSCLLACWVSGIFFSFPRLIAILFSSIYILSLIAVGFSVAIKNRIISYIFGIPLAIATMHFSWGSAFLWSLMEMPFSKEKNA